MIYRNTHAKFGFSTDICDIRRKFLEYIDKL